MNPGDITEGMKVRLTAPLDHPLHRAAGVVIRTFTAEQLWEREPMTMLGDPFTWLAGQVLVSLDEPRPRDGKDRPWTPVVTVRPDDVEDASQPPVLTAREKMRELLAAWTESGNLLTEGLLRAALEAHGYEVDRRTLHRWLEQDAARRRPGEAP
jgi:hypothetical protein